MTEQEKDEIIIRAVAYIINDQRIKGELWKLLAADMFRVMAQVDALEKKSERKEIDAKINSRKSS